MHRVIDRVAANRGAPYAVAFQAASRLKAGFLRQRLSVYCRKETFPHQ